MLREWIGKLLKRFKKEDKPMSLQPNKDYNPTYPQDLAEMFPENRTENHTDTCQWQKFDKDK